MANSNTPSIANLKRAIDIAEQIEKLQAQLVALVGGGSVPVAPAKPAAVAATTAPTPRKGRKGGRRALSPEARERIAAAQRARWAKSRVPVMAPAAKSPAPKAPAAKAPAATTPAVKAPAAPAPVGKKKGKKRALTPEGRARLSALLKARWAARKKGGPAPNAAKK